MTINYNEFNDNNDLMDALLDKVSMDGFDKLSEQEKDLLNKISNGNTIDLDKLKEEKGLPSDSPKYVIGGGFSHQRDVIDKDVGDIRIEQKQPNRFDVGDEVYPLSKTGDSLPPHATHHLNTKDKFTVLKTNSSGKIDIGCHKRTEKGKKRVFYYSTNRFTSIDPSTEIDSGDS